MSTVIVNNIAPQTSEVTISEFFSFCGKIVALKVQPVDDVLQAVITFESPTAAKTSLLLTNALINDKPIQVSLAPEEFINTSNTTEPNPNIVNKAHEVPADQRSTTSVIASILAAGYKLNDDALAAAREFDAKLNFTQTASELAQGAKEKIVELDSNLGLSEKLKNVTNVVVEKGKILDQQYHVSQRASEFAASANQIFGTVAQQASHTLESVIKSGASAFETNAPRAAESLKQAGANVSATVNEVRTEAKMLYEHQKEQHAPEKGDVQATTQTEMEPLPSESQQ